MELIGCIYKLTCNTTQKCYYGSTKHKNINRRLTCHKNDYKRYLNGKYNHTTSFDIIKNNNYKIELVEEVPYENKEQLKLRERHYIENFECVNKNIPCQTRKERDAKNIEYLRAYKKEYCKKYFTCECGKEVRCNDKGQHFKTKYHNKAIQQKAKADAPQQVVSS